MVTKSLFEVLVCSLLRFIIDTLELFFKCQERQALELGNCQWKLPTMAAVNSGGSRRYVGQGVNSICYRGRDELGVAPLPSKNSPPYEKDKLDQQANYSLAQNSIQTTWGHVDSYLEDE